MIKINIVAVGKIKEKYFTDAIGEYSKRLSKYCQFKIVEVNEATNYKNLEEKNRIEGNLILSKAKGIIVSLDRKGKLLSSEELSNNINDYMVNGISEISFIIGGSNGLSEEVLKASKNIISFGKITYPHQLFRVVLCEQIYRAFTILNGTAYHK